MEGFRKTKYLFLGVFPVLLACVEIFEPETITFESAIVIEATITNELKQHEVKLSRSYSFEADGPEVVRNAEVAVLDDQGGEYLFEESAPGTYLSRDSFAAQEGRSYRLQVTANGRTYGSASSELTPQAQMDAVYAERLTNAEGVEGVAIRVDASSPSENARNYRYTFEEAYKIIAPRWSPFTLIPDPQSPCGMIKVAKEVENRVCYNTEASRSIVLTNTNGLAQDRVSGFIIRFIDRDNYIISHRYSILVRQLVQSDAAYSFFETLESFSGSESLFSETQPGFLEGNVFAEGEAAEKVLGYFDVASVSERRIFFNYDDLFPGEPLPPYADPCRLNAIPLISDGIPPVCVLRPLVELNIVSFFKENAGELEGGPFLTSPFECGDCTALGETAVPEFWTEE